MSGRLQNVAAIAAATWALACNAFADSPDGLASVDAALPAPGDATRFEVSRADAFDRWRLSAASSRDWDPAASRVFARVDPRGALFGDIARAHLAFDWQRRLVGGRLEASAFADGTRADFGDAPAGMPAFAQRQRDSSFGAALQWGGNSFIGRVPLATAVAARVKASGSDWRSGITDERGELRSLAADRASATAATLDLASEALLPFGMRAAVGARLDAFRGAVRSDGATRAGDLAASLVSPRFSLRMALAGGNSAYLSFARGLGPEDSRSLSMVDPRTHAPGARLDPLSALETLEVGFRGHWLPGADTSVSMFRVKSDNELFLRGENAITEFSRPTVRHGVQAALRWEPASWLTVDLQAAALTARFADGANEYVPGAAERTASAAATVRTPSGWTASLLVNALGRRDEGFTALRASTFVNARLTRPLSKKTRVFLDVFNVFDQRLRDVDYLSTTRLWTQPGAGGDNYLFNPAEPRGFRIKFRRTF